MAFTDHRSLHADRALTLLAGIPYVYHCHHYNLFHDQTIDDALGELDGARVRTNAARHAFRDLLSAVFKKENAVTTSERLTLASELFRWMGQGKIQLELLSTSGRARSLTPHYGYAWKEKYGSRIRRHDPVDAVAAGFAAAAMELIYDLAPDSVAAKEHRCIAMRDPQCEFDLTLGRGGAALATIDEEASLKFSAEPQAGIDEDRIKAISSGLWDFMRAVQGDERGLIAAFNVFVTTHLPTYYNETIYETVHHTESVSPALVPAVEELFREAGRACVFFTFGNVMLSPEWEALVGPPSGISTDVISFCTAMARGLGFGHWLVHEYEPRKRFVLRCTSNYEVPFYLSRYGRSSKPRSYFIQGAAAAMMTLAEGVRWRERPQLTGDYYLEVFRSRAHYRVEQTQCAMRGDSISEYVVEAT
jgi:hypothetical protein